MKDREEARSTNGMKQGRSLNSIFLDSKLQSAATCRCSYLYDAAHG
jgi:hypothetical protein